MKRTKITEQQIVFALKQVDTGTRVKLLLWEGDGLPVYYKRL
jgi:hypothetical protein